MDMRFYVRWNGYFCPPLQNIMGLLHIVKHTHIVIVNNSIWNFFRYTAPKGSRDESICNQAIVQLFRYLAAYL